VDMTDETQISTDKAAGGGSFIPSLSTIGKSL
jgi:hypothetical protein